MYDPYDLKVLKQPKEMILNQGGAIFLGLLNGEAVATFALTPQGPGVVELNKMAVRDDCQSMGIGQHLMHFMMAECKRTGVNVIELYSHTKLKSALHIYRKFGFTDTPSQRTACTTAPTFECDLSWTPHHAVTSKHHERRHLPSLPRTLTTALDGVAT